MSLDSIVQLSITVGNPIIDTASFGVPMLMSSEANGKFSGRVKLYSSAAELLDDGFTASGVAYRMATAVESQNPSPATFMIGKRILSGGALFDYDLTIGEGYEADVYSITIGSDVYSYTKPDGYSNAQVASELADLITDPDLTVTVNSEVITVISVIPGWFPIISISSNIGIKDMTPSVGADLTTDLAGALEYNSGWYALLIDSNTPEDIKAAAAFAEANRRMFAFETTDADVLDQGSTTDIFSELKALSYANTIGIYSDEKNEGKAAAWVGKCLPYDPGTVNWAHKVLAGVSTDALSRSKESIIESKSGNYYSIVAGRGNTFSGITPSGEFIDTANVVHLLYARIQEAVISVLKGNQKLPYTNAGVAAIAGVIKGVLDAEVGKGLTNDPVAPFVNVPRVETIAVNIKQARHVPDITFTAVLSGAINSVSIRGTLTLDTTAFVVG